MWFSLLFAACGPSSGTDSAPFFGSDEVSEPHHPDAAYTADEAAQLLVDGVQYGYPMPGPLVNLWKEFLGNGDETCPGGGYIGGGLSTTQVDGCVADSGYWYNGVGGSGMGWTDEDWDGDQDTFFLNMKTDGAMADPEGNVFSFGGDMKIEVTGTPMEGGPFEGYILGSYTYAGSDVPWIREGVSTASYIDGTVDKTGAWTLNVDGGFSVAGVAVSMVNFGIHGVCGDAPTGTIGVRDASGYWYDLTYDETTCDSCGTVTFDHRESLGHACANVTPAFVESMSTFAADLSIGGPG